MIRSTRRGIRRLRRFFRNLVVERLETRTMPASIAVVGQPTWIPVTPGPISGGQAEGIVIPAVGQLPELTNPVSGTISAIAVPTGSIDIAYVGTANGGVWKTILLSNGSSPVWQTTTGKMPSLAIDTLAIDPSDPSFNTVYAGIANPYDVIGQLSQGAGLLKTTDGGNTWTAIGDTTLLGQKVLAVIPLTHQVGSQTISEVLVATEGYMAVSVDGGISFSALLSARPAGELSNMVANPGGGPPIGIITD